MVTPTLLTDSTRCLRPPYLPLSVGRTPPSCAGTVEGPLHHGVDSEVPVLPIPKDMRDTKHPNKSDVFRSRGLTRGRSLVFTRPSLLTLNSLLPYYDGLLICSPSVPDLRPGSRHTGVRRGRERPEIEGTDICFPVPSREIRDSPAPGY